MLNITTFNTQRDFRREEIHRDVLSLIQAQRTKSILCLQEVTPDLVCSITTWQKEENEKVRLVQCGENAIYLSPDIDVKRVKEIVVGDNRSFVGADFEIEEVQSSIYSGKLRPGLDDYRRRKGLESLLSQIEAKRFIIGMDSNMWYTQEKNHALKPLQEKYGFDYYFGEDSCHLERSEHRKKFPLCLLNDRFLKRKSTGIDGIIWKGFQQASKGKQLYNIQSSDHDPVMIDLQ